MKKIILLIAFVNCSTILFAQNLLQNSGFEATALTPWQTFGGGSPLQLQSDIAHTGSNALKVYNRTSSYQGVGQSVYSTIQQNVWYEFTAWVNAVSVPAATNYFTINLKLTPNSGAIQYTQIAVLRAYKTGWVKVRGYYKLTNPVSNYTDIQVYVLGPATTSIDFYIDDISIMPPDTYSPPPFNAASFVKANNRNLQTGNTPIILRGINFSDYSDTYPYSSGENAYNQIYNTYHFDWSDYAYVRNLGLNTVRLNMDFRAFEDDANPNIYKMEGWHWLEKNILAARENGVYLILDLHTPQGGYQSYGYTGSFWQSTQAALNNRNRFIALWKTIAQRYKDEPIIAGLDLINEPLLPTVAGQSTSNLYTNFINQVIDSIRTVDNNHLIIVEQAFKNNGTYNLALLDDDNVMYDSHFYIPWDYCSQLDPNYGANNYGPYPNTTYNWNKSQIINEMLSEGLQFSIDNNVPINTGEFGIVRMVAQQPTYGSATYLNDIQCICDSLNINAQLFTHHYYGSSFGLFYNTYGFPDNDYKVSVVENFLDNFSPAYPGGIVTGGGTINAGEHSDTLWLSNYNGNIIKWQSSVSPFTNWTDIPNSNNNYISDILTQTTQFRAVIGGPCTYAYSSAATVTVESQGCNLNITIAGNSASCSDDIQTYSATQITGAIYQWTVSGGIILDGQSTNTITIQWANGVIGSVNVDVLQ